MMAAMEDDADLDEDGADDGGREKRAAGGMELAANNGRVALSDEEDESEDEDEEEEEHEEEVPLDRANLKDSATAAVERGYLEIINTRWGIRTVNQGIFAQTKLEHGHLAPFDQITEVESDLLFTFNLRRKSIQRWERTISGYSSYASARTCACDTKMVPRLHDIIS